LPPYFSLWENLQSAIAEWLSSALIRPASVAIRDRSVERNATGVESLWDRL
jgi:hypothetical protein